MAANPAVSTGQLEPAYRRGLRLRSWPQVKRRQRPLRGGEVELLATARRSTAPPQRTRLARGSHFGAMALDVIEMPYEHGNSGSDRRALPR